MLKIFLRPSKSFCLYGLLLLLFNILDIKTQTFKNIYLLNHLKITIIPLHVKTNNFVLDNLFLL